MDVGGQKCVAYLCFGNGYAHKVGERVDSDGDGAISDGKSPHFDAGQSIHDPLESDGLLNRIATVLLDFVKD